MQVIVTRPAAQAAEWVVELRARHIDALALPLIGIEPPEDREAVTAAWAGIDHQRLVVFVSPNAAEQFFAAAPAEARWPAATQAGSPGPGTTRALVKLGVPLASIVAPAPDAAEFDSEALWAELAGSDWQGANVLVVRGDGGREWLTDTLRGRGAQVRHVAAYRRVPPRLDASQLAAMQHAVEQPASHLWLFSSSEAIDHLVELQPRADWTGARIIATHARISARARQLGRVQVYESLPALDAVVACIQSLPTVSDVSAVSDPPPSPDVAPAAGAAPPGPAALVAGLPFVALRAGLAAAAVLLGGLAVASLVLAWRADQRVVHLEQELVRRQQESAGRSTEARMLAKQAEESVRETAAKLALLEARVAEVAIQRSQLEDLIQSLSRSRDDNLVVDVEATIRVALQQTAISGSAEPLVAALKQADERLARHEQPRLEGVRRAIARDLDRVKSASVADISTLSIKLDEAVRMVDQLPLLAGAEARTDDPTQATATATAVARSATSSASAASASASASGINFDALWPSGVGEVWKRVTSGLWSEARALVRVTRIDRPEAMLLAPEQAFFLKENLKLRLLNARLAVLSRQFDTARTDLQVARTALDHYFDPGSRRTLLVAELLTQVSAHARDVGVPRPDDTLAALAAASAGR